MISTVPIPWLFIVIQFILSSPVFFTDRNVVAQRKDSAGEMIAFDNIQCGLSLKRRRREGGQ